MTKRNRNSKVRQVDKAQKQSENNNPQRRYNMFEIIVAIITIVISITSLIVSIIAIRYADKEYEYKLSPEVSVQADVKIKVDQVYDKIDKKIISERIKINIINKNNLEKAYLIYPNNVVKNLNVNEIENTLEENLNEDIRLENYDLELGGKFYQYRFLLLMGMDGSYELYLIYVKTGGEELVINSVSGIEIWGLANSNNDNPEYEGERIMAEKYQKILEESYNYIK